MKRSGLTLLAGMALALLASQACAASVSIGGKHSRGEIKATCAAAGGRYASTLDGYNCFKPNCDGQGGMCAVSCENDGSCRGYTPRTISKPAKTPAGILAN